MNRREYAETYGPSKGDRIHLGDTGLVAEVEDSLIPEGQECLIGTGKTLREGMHVHPGGHPSGLDTVVLNAVIFDPVTGIIKADIGIQDGIITGIGNAGNPDVADITSGLVIDSSTSLIQAAGSIVTPGGVDAHQHFMSPEVIDSALNSGITSILGMGHGPNPQAKTDPSHLEDAIRGIEQYPVNVGFIGAGSTISREAAIDLIEAGVCGLKIHEDHGAYPAIFENILEVCEEYGVQLAFHTDSLNESGGLETTLSVIDGRTAHAYHVEGAGGGHIPDLLEVVEFESLLPSSTNPTIPHTPSTRREQRTLTSIVHHLDDSLEEDAAFAEARARDYTQAAEDFLHDIGAISMINSDSMGMGRAGETIIRTWQLASKMKNFHGDSPPDNNRILRYLAKYTVNPAIAHGINNYVGSIGAEKLADLVVWDPAFFGVKPDWIIKSGMIVAGPMGDPNGTTYYGEPTYYRRNLGATGNAPGPLSLLFTSAYAAENRSPSDLGTTRMLAPVKDTRNITKNQMIRNSTTPDVEVDHDTYQVQVNGQVVEVEPRKETPLTHRYFI